MLAGNGRLCYETYGEKQGWKNFLGEPMPSWDNLTERRRISWQFAADAVVTEFIQSLLGTVGTKQQIKPLITMVNAHVDED
jgi:hypothetical protein